MLDRCPYQFEFGFVILYISRQAWRSWSTLCHVFDDTFPRMSCIFSQVDFAKLRIGLSLMTHFIACRYIYFQVDFAELEHLMSCKGLSLMTHLLTCHVYFQVDFAELEHLMSRIGLSLMTHFVTFRRKEINNLGEFSSAFFATQDKNKRYNVRHVFN